MLEALPSGEAHVLWPHLERLRLAKGQPVLEDGWSSHHVYFPTTAVVSFQCALASGESAEFAVVGYEGAIGFPFQVFGRVSSIRADVTCAGEALRLPVAALDRVPGHAALWTLSYRHALSILVQAAQSTVCSHKHSLAEQLCKLLLVRLDRLPGATIETTQEALAAALGRRREGVTQAAHRLQDDGVIRYSRGRIDILNRPLLEQRACECYQVVKLQGVGPQAPIELR